MVRSVALFVNLHKPQARGWASEVARAFEKRKVRVSTVKSFAQLQGLRPFPELLISVGGDGTVLQAARMAAPLGVPLLGLHAGDFGFLTVLEPRRCASELGRVLRWEYPVQERWMLQAAVEDSRGRPKRSRALALNDCVIRSGEEARPVELKASISGSAIASYYGDGVIVSSPTGSTAYALASGGPIVHPELDVLLLLPICPHTLTHRPLVVPGKEELRITVVSRPGKESGTTILSFDGQESLRLRVGDCIRVRRFERPLKLLAHPARSTFEVLREKLRWGERAG
ncbi:MAG: NAD(+)/NADH kinase [Elusimicrobia bacterium]|nr:NAD(+)/NADH kinase [Elusimicrobiota bacterium]